MLLKSEIEKAVNSQKGWLERKSKGLPRDVLGEVKLSDKYVQIITGIRRCGKSTLLHQLAVDLGKHYAFFNFEDPRVFGFDSEDFAKLLDIFGDAVSHYFFDEIQNVDGWEVFVRYLHDRGNTICVTGSNASLLSREHGTRLTGRNLQKELLPFSYAEYLRFRKKERGRKTLLAYLEQGGFPDYLHTADNEILQQLLYDVLYRDIIVRHGIRSDQTVSQIALHLISNVGKIFSLNKLKNSFGVGSASSVADYVRWLEDSYLIFSLRKFSWSAKSISVNPKKIYTIDTGFARANSLSFSTDDGRLLENLVYLDLRRRMEDIFYFQEDGECDFVIKTGNSITSAIQVCNELTSDNLQRERDGLMRALNFFDLHEGLILTLDQRDELSYEGKRISILPLSEWLS